MVWTETMAESKATHSRRESCAPNFLSCCIRYVLELRIAVEKGTVCAIRLVCGIPVAAYIGIVWIVVLDAKGLL